MLLLLLAMCVSLDASSACVRTKQPRFNYHMYKVHVTDTAGVHVHWRVYTCMIEVNIYCLDEYNNYTFRVVVCCLATKI